MQELIDRILKALNEIVDCKYHSLDDHLLHIEFEPMHNGNNNCFTAALIRDMEKAVQWVDSEPYFWQFGEHNMLCMSIDLLEWQILKRKWQQP